MEDLKKIIPYVSSHECEANPGVNAQLEMSSEDLGQDYPSSPSPGPSTRLGLPVISSTYSLGRAFTSQLSFLLVKGSDSVGYSLTQKDLVETDVVAHVYFHHFGD